jgi:hypothetical protein
VVIPDFFILLIVFLSQMAGHWMPWKVIPALVDEAGLLRRPLAYTHGCGWILLGMVFYALLHPEAWPFVSFLAMTMAAAGIGTMLPRGIRAIGEAQFLRRDKEDLEKLVDGQTDS